ncbi:hypothetical protein [Amycolatopsis sp. NPDC098790]|uniref:hypothetical protein n=1 Tax=Amycolatopsis sp. NPDC098790 TaxID=3363939 RepID=UPI0037F68E7E
MDDDRVELPLTFAVFAGVVAFFDAGQRGDEPDVGLEGDVQARPGQPAVVVGAAEVPVRGRGVAFPADDGVGMRVDRGVDGQIGRCGGFGVVRADIGLWMVKPEPGRSPAMATHMPWSCTTVPGRCWPSQAKSTRSPSVLRC